MTDKELRRLNRAELLEMLLAQSREADQLREQLQQAEARLRSRQIALDKAGSIAEAALQINQIFDAAQQAADQYLENIQALSGRQETVCAQMEADSRREADRLLVETRAKCQAMEAETEAKCQAMTQEAKAKASRVWEEMQQKLKQLMDQQAGLRELLQVVSGETKRT